MKMISLPADERLLLFGYGVFETILVTERGARFLTEHWQRMLSGATKLGLPLAGYVDWRAEILTFLQEEPNQIKPFALRVTLSGGSPAGCFPPKLLFLIRPLLYTREQYTQGVRTVFLTTRRNELSPLSRIKSANYLENLLARSESDAHGAFEGLWLNTRGLLAEGSISNLFFVRNGRLFTPSLDCGCLPGTRRAIVLRLAASLGIPAAEGEFRPEDLNDAEEVFLTNALMGIMPVQSVDKHQYLVASPNNNLSLTRRIEQAYLSLLEVIDDSPAGTWN